MSTIFKRPALFFIIYASDTTLTANLEEFSAKSIKDLDSKIIAKINKITIWFKTKSSFS